jgi:hypothetical protein
MTRVGERLSVVAFVLVAIASIVGVAFAAGYILGKLLL